MNKTLSLKTLALGRLGMLAIASSFCGLATAQIKDVKGTITDSSGEPLIGVSIMEKGTSILLMVLYQILMVTSQFLQTRVIHW